MIPPIEQNNKLIMKLYNNHWLNIKPVFTIHNMQKVTCTKDNVKVFNKMDTTLHCCHTVHTQTAICMSLIFVDSLGQGLVNSLN